MVRNNILDINKGMLSHTSLHKKNKFSIKDLLSKCDQIRRNPY